MTMQTQEQMREMNRWLAVNLFGKHLYEWTYRGCKHCGNLGSAAVHDWPNYSEDPAAAMEVLSKCAERLEEEDNEETVSIAKDGPYWIVEKTNNLKNLRTEHASRETCICLFAKALFSK